MPHRLQHQATTIGYDFDNAEVVLNPLMIENASAIPWPHQTCNQVLRLACVARLYATQKGQDILLDVLASPCWRERNWRLTLYGDGPNRDVLGHLVERLKLQARVSFAGYVAIEKIWRENHVLVMPSRYEGMPMTIVEATQRRPVLLSLVPCAARLLSPRLMFWPCRKSMFPTRAVMNSNGRFALHQAPTERREPNKRIWRFRPENKVSNAAWLKLIESFFPLTSRTTDFFSDIRELSSTTLAPSTNTRSQ